MGLHFAELERAICNPVKFLMNHSTNKAFYFLYRGMYLTIYIYRVAYQKRTETYN